MDSRTRNRISSDVFIRIAGHHDGHFVTDDDGYSIISGLEERGYLDLIQVFSHSRSYWPTWITSHNHPEEFPDEIPLFPKSKIREYLTQVKEKVLSHEGLIFGELSSKFVSRLGGQCQKFQVKIINGLGEEEPNALTYYRDPRDEVLSFDRDQKSGECNANQFIVTGLMPGEYHLALFDSEEGHWLGLQVIRIGRNALSYAYF